MIPLRFQILSSVAMMLVLGCQVQLSFGQPGSRAEKYLDAAMQVEGWLDSVKRIDDAGHVFWPTTPDQSNAYSLDTYHGFAGVIGFYLRLYRVTNDKQYLQTAIRGADHFVDRIAGLDPNEPPGLYTGVAGHGQMMIRIWEVTHREKYKRAALQCLNHIESQAKSKDDYQGNACHFNGVTDVISGSAGILHFLLMAHQTLDSQSALDLAIRCGDGLVIDGVTTESNGAAAERMHWQMTDGLERAYPNLSHGTAGVCGALMQLDAVVRVDHASKGLTYDNRFIEAAVKGARYLESIANVRTDQGLIFHHAPGGEDLFYLGWCHGPPGTSAMLLGLGERTQDEDLQRWAIAGAKTLVRLDLSRNRTPGFWNNVGQCCGTAGVAKFLAGVFMKTGEEIYLEECRKLTDDLLERATEVKLPNGLIGLKWMQAEHRVRPKELKAQTGYMQGAAGIGEWLLDMHELELGINH